MSSIANLIVRIKSVNEYIHLAKRPVRYQISKGANSTSNRTEATNLGGDEGRKRPASNEAHCDYGVCVAVVVERRGDFGDTSHRNQLAN